MSARRRLGSASVVAAERVAAACVAAACVAAACVAAGVVGCASPGAPPGGPADRNAPVIVKVTPDSGARNVKERGVTVRFNEVISERPRAGNDLGAVVVLSPSDGAARVQWQRNAITVRPRKGFRPNTAYALTLMPGLSDLTGNATLRERTFVFSTGGAMPSGVVRGAVFDWTTLKPANGVLVDARTGNDTTFRWIARTDTTGRFTIPLLPPGAYTLRAILDANANGRLEPRELWDSVTVSVADSLRVDLYAFVHDTLGPRVVGADVRDSLTLRLSFDRPLAPTPMLATGQVRLLTADSTALRVRVVVTAAMYDSLARARETASRDSALRSDTSAAGRTARARADSLRVIFGRDSVERTRVEARRAARDTTPKLVRPVPARAAITADFVALLDDPLVPGSYRISVQDAVSVSGVKRSSERTFTRAKPAAKKTDTERRPPEVRAKPAPAPAPTKPPAARPAAEQSAAVNPPAAASPAEPHAP